MSAPRELFYRIGGSAGGAMPGHHRSRGGASGMEFRTHAPLGDWPDARRLDLHASLRDPFGRWLVRLSSERRALAVAVVADLSASMAFEGRVRRMDVLADFTESLAWSAWRTGDAFAFVGCDDRVRPEFRLTATRRRAAGLALAASLRGFVPQGTSAAALLEAAHGLPQRRSLVFLVSDFHLPLDQLDRVLSRLAAHEVVPLRLRDASEYQPAAQPGFAPVREPESGRRGWLWWRPALRERWAVAAAARDAELAALFDRHRLGAVTLDGAFDADVVNRRFAA